MPEYQWISDRIFTVSEFFTPAECDAHIKLAEGNGFDEAPINTPFGPELRKDVRNNTRVIVDDISRAQELWSRIQDYIPHAFAGWQACGVNERFRYYRYEVGQQFDWHYDGYFERRTGERSQFTFMVYLNEGFTGGATTIEKLDIVPRQGMALFFTHRLLHKGQPVESGVKYVLRTDVMYRRATD